MMNKKVFCITVLVFAYYLIVYPQATWEKIKTPTDFNLLKVSYLDSLHCWVAGDSGVIMFSNDQGDTWEMQNSGVSNYIEDIFFLNENLGWALSYDYEGGNLDIRSKILITNNGGLNWEINYFRNLNIILTTIYFQDSLNGWVGSRPGGISYTQDGGYSWFESTIDTGLFRYLPVEQIGFSTPQYGFAVGGQVDNVGVVWSTSDSGKVWMPHGIGADFFLDSIFMDSTSIISLTGEKEGNYPTANLKFNLLDNSWEYMNTPEYVYITGLSLRTPSEIWGAIGRREPKFIVSNNSGTSWKLLDTPDSLITLDVEFADSLHGIAVGRGGYILKYIPEKPVNVENVDSQFPLDFVLEQNYPNPFNPSTKIRWQSPVSGHHTLKVYDVLGTEIATLVDEYKSAGSYEVEFNVAQSAAADFPAITSGIYFYQLKVADKVETKKMLLLK